MKTREILKYWYQERSKLKQTKEAESSDHPRTTRRLPLPAAAAAAAVRADSALLVLAMYVYTSGIPPAHRSSRMGSSPLVGFAC